MGCVPIFYENQPSLFITSFVILLLGPSPLATETPTFFPTASDISATFWWVNPGQRSMEWIPSSLTNLSQTSTACSWFFTNLIRSLYLGVSTTHWCFSGSASGVWAIKTTLKAILITSYFIFWPDYYFLLAKLYILIFYKISKNPLFL